MSTNNQSIQNSLEAMNDQISIAGIGIITPHGENVTANHSVVNAGNDVPLKDTIENFKPADYFKRRYLRPLDDVTIRSIAMVTAAMRDAGIALEDLPADRVGLVLGSVFAGIGCIFDFKQTCFEGRENDYLGLSPLYFPGIVFNSISGQPAIEYGFTGPNAVINGGFSSGLLAVIKGAEYLLSGKADVVFAGGSEMNHPFIQKKLLADKDQDYVRLQGKNFHTSEATCLYLLHRKGDERFAGLKHYADISGWQYGFCPNGLNAQAVSGALSKVLKRSGAEKIEAVVCDADADTPLGAIEQAGLAQAFETTQLNNDTIKSDTIKSDTMLLNNKSVFGHSLGASGSLNLYQGLMHINDLSKTERNNAVLINSIDAAGSYAFMTLQTGQ
ncbi:beta-ketoacyl synthase N-terminal-like domain-containing protein [Aliikangiella maris]|uniref:Beta-ketoacyl synthase N-terminal-like domain-containing protein n=2 Tax=Aliikangiella maris TaxID=3162458 RepID=A0ABV2BTX8_9GAMM